MLIIRRRIKVINEKTTPKSMCGVGLGSLLITPKTERKTIKSLLGIIEEEDRKPRPYVVGGSYEIRPKLAQIKGRPYWAKLTRTAPL